MGRRRIVGGQALAVAALFALIASIDSTSAQATPASLAEPGLGREEHVGPSKDEVAGLGCLAAGTAAVVAVGALGVATAAATGGAAVANPTVVLPVLGTAFAAGCGVGVMAAPGAAWLIDHYVLGIHRPLN